MPWIDIDFVIGFASIPFHVDSLNKESDDRIILNSAREVPRANFKIILKYYLGLLNGGNIELFNIL